MDINANPSDLIYQNLKKDFQAGIEEARTIADPIYKTVSSTGNANVYSWLGHIPGFKEWFQNQQRVLRNVESFDYAVANRKFEDTIQISVDDVEDNQLGQYSGIVKSMAATGKLVYDELVFDLFNNAFTGTVTYDGQPWIADAHKVGLSTIDNDLDGAVLNDTNFEAAVTKLRSFTVKPDKLSKARPLNPVADKLILVCNPALEATAKKILMRQTLDNGADNINYQAAEIMATSYIQSTTAWFVVNVGAPIPAVYVQERKKLEFRTLTPKDSDMSFMGDTFVYGAKVRCAALPTHPWLIVGSTGA